MVCLLGCAGAGVSATGNCIAGYADAFHESSSMHSQPHAVCGKVCNWYGAESNDALILIDTPGFSSSYGEVPESVAAMAETL